MLQYMHFHSSIFSCFTDLFTVYLILCTQSIARKTKFYFLKNSFKRLSKHFTHAPIQAALPLPFVLGRIHRNSKEVKLHIPTTPFFFFCPSFICT